MLGRKLNHRLLITRKRISLYRPTFTGITNGLHAVPFNRKEKSN